MRFGAREGIGNPICGGSMRRMSRTADGRSGAAYGRRLSGRGRMAVALGVSALFHGALLAWVSLSIPEEFPCRTGV